jgi:hypothetical protein
MALKCRNAKQIQGRRVRGGPELIPPHALSLSLHEQTRKLQHLGNIPGVRDPFFKFSQHDFSVKRLTAGFFIDCCKTAFLTKGLTTANTKGM